MNPVLARSLFRCAPLEKRPSAGQRMTPPPALPPDHNVSVCVCVHVPIWASTVRRESLL